MSDRDSKQNPAIGFFTVVSQADQSWIGGYLLLNASGRPLEFHCTAPVKANRAQEILYGPTLLPFLYGEQIGKTLLNKSKVEALFVCTDVAPALALREFVKMPVVLVTPAAAPAPDVAPLAAAATTVAAALAAESAPAAVAVADAMEGVADAAPANTTPADNPLPDVTPSAIAPADMPAGALATRVDPPHGAAAGCGGLRRPKLLRLPLAEYEFAVTAAYAQDGEDAAGRWRPFAENFDLLEPFARIRDAIAEAQRVAR